MILEGGVLLLTETVTKSNRLVKCLDLPRRAFFIYCGSQKMSATVNQFTEDRLQKSAFTVVGLLKRLASVNRGRAHSAQRGLSWPVIALRIYIPHLGLGFHSHPHVSLSQLLVPPSLNFTPPSLGGSLAGVVLAQRGGTRHDKAAAQERTAAARGVRRGACSTVAHERAWRGAAVKSGGTRRGARGMEAARGALQQRPVRAWLRKRDALQRRPARTWPRQRGGSISPTHSGGSLARDMDPRWPGLDPMAEPPICGSRALIRRWGLRSGGGGTDPTTG